MKTGIAITLFVAFFVVPSVHAQAPDVVLVNGKVLTVDPQFSIRQAVAISEGRIAAVGTTAEIRKLAGSDTRVIDLGGRTVIPGLMDSHLHAIRAALSFSTEVNWTGARSKAEALGRISEAAKRMKPGSWLVVAGGWNEQQFAEGRWRPTQADLVAAAPDNPVYVQLGYGWILMSPAGHKTMGITGDADLPEKARLERDASGQLTGAIVGGQNDIVAVFEKLPKPTFEQQVEGTRLFFRELNRLGMTSVGDPGGTNLYAQHYGAVFDVWRRKQMTVRIAYSLYGQPPGPEFDDFKRLTAMLPMGFGDDLLKFNGIGERLTIAMNNNDNPSDAEKEKFYEIIRWAAGLGMTVTMHWGNDSSVHHLLGMYERVNKEVPIAGLRWSIAHLNDASEATLKRMKALGVAWTVQDAMYFGGEGFVKQAGPEAAKRVPPVMTAKKIGVPVGAGTDAHRVASYNPFTSLQWFLDGKTVSGVALRGPEETPDRADALRFYTLGSAWFSFDEHKKGSLEVGKFADLAVLSKDYMTVPVEQVGSIESVLTMLGGKIVYAAGPFAKLEDAHSSP